MIVRFANTKIYTESIRGYDVRGTSLVITLDNGTTLTEHLSNEDESAERMLEIVNIGFALSPAPTEEQKAKAQTKSLIAEILVKAGLEKIKKEDIVQ